MFRAVSSFLCRFKFLLFFSNRRHFETSNNRAMDGFTLYFFFFKLKNYTKPCVFFFSNTQIAINPNFDFFPPKTKPLFYSTILLCSPDLLWTPYSTSSHSSFLIWETGSFHSIWASDETNGPWVNETNNGNKFSNQGLLRVTKNYNKKNSVTWRNYSPSIQEGVPAANG